MGKETAITITFLWLIVKFASGIDNWPRDANRIPISLNPKAIFNDYWRDVMNSRVTRMQHMLNQAQTDDEKQRWATAILKNYVAQSEMRELQRKIDNPDDWTPKELEQFTFKLASMMNIVRQGRDPDIDLDLGE